MLKPPPSEGVLPWANPAWVMLVGVIHCIGVALEVYVVAMVFYSGLSQPEYYKAEVQVDYSPTDLVITSPDEWSALAVQDVCAFVGCASHYVTTNLTNAIDPFVTQSGIVLTLGIQIFQMHIINPTEWGYPAPTTQMLVMEKIIGNPTAKIYAEPYTRLSAGSASTLRVETGPLTELPPAEAWFNTAVGFGAFTFLALLVVICCIDPETTKDPYPSGWELEGLPDSDDEEHMSAERKLQLAMEGIDEETRRKAREARKREEAAARQQQRRHRCRTRYRRSCTLLICYPFFFMCYVRSSLKSTKESFMLPLLKMITSMFQSIPLCALYLWLSMSTPRGISLDMSLAFLFCVISFAITLLLWDRAHIRSEHGLIVRLQHPALVMLTVARMCEIASRLLIFAAAGAAFGGSVTIGLLWLDIAGVVGVVLWTWKRQNQVLSGHRQNLASAVRHAIFFVPLLIIVHFDHVPGRGGGVLPNSVADPRAYYAWRFSQQAVLAVLAFSRLPIMNVIVGSGWYSTGVALGCVLTLIGAYLTTRAWMEIQKVLELPCVGIGFPALPICRRKATFDLNATSKSFTGSDAARSERDHHGERVSSLMELYGGKVQAMQEESLRRAVDLEERRRDEEEGGDSWYSDDEQASEHHSQRYQEIQSDYIFQGTNVTALLERTQNLLNDTVPVCRGCEGLSMQHEPDFCKKMSPGPPPAHSRLDEAMSPVDKDKPLSEVARRLEFVKTTGSPSPDSDNEA